MQGKFWVSRKDMKTLQQDHACLAVYMYLNSMAVFKDFTFKRKNGLEVTVPRGCCHTTQTQIAAALKMNRSLVERKVKILKSLDLISVTHFKKIEVKTGVKTEVKTEVKNEVKNEAKIFFYKINNYDDLNYNDIEAVEVETEAENGQDPRQKVGSKAPDLKNNDKKTENNTEKNIGFAREESPATTPNKESAKKVKKKTVKKAKKLVQVWDANHDYSDIFRNLMSWPPYAKIFDLKTEEAKIAKHMERYGLSIAEVEQATYDLCSGDRSTLCPRSTFNTFCKNVKRFSANKSEKIYFKSPAEKLRHEQDEALKERYWGDEELDYIGKKRS